MTLTTLTELVQHYGYPLLLIIAIIEGPIITVIAGALCLLGYLSFWPAYIVVVIGDTIGDMLHYAAGRYGGRPFVERWGRYLGVQSSHIESMEHTFARHEVKSYLLGKLAHGVGGAVLVVAGLVKAPLNRFLVWNVIATLVKSLGLLLIGYYFVHAVVKIDSVFNVVASALVVLSVLSFFVGFWWYGKKVRT